MKSMSDGEVNKYVFDKLIGDLGGIEAHGMFNEDENTHEDEEGTKPVTGGVSIEIKPLMAGSQTKAAPEVLAADEDDEDLSKFDL